jgi:flagellar FliL protein
MADTENAKVNASLDDDRDEFGEDEKGGGLTLKKILLILIPLLLIGGGALAYFTGMINLGGGETEEHSEEGGKGGHGGGSATFLEIPDMIVNLSSDDGQPRYLRLSVQLELESEADKAAVEQVMPRVIDQFQTYLRELRVQDLRGSAGIYRLQMELLSRVNAAAYPVEVQDVLFQEILIQ